jgi:hypothetical protein
MCYDRGRCRAGEEVMSSSEAESILKASEAVISLLWRFRTKRNRQRVDPALQMGQSASATRSTSLTSSWRVASYP